MENIQLRIGLPLAYPGDDGTYPLNAVDTGKNEEYLVKLLTPVTVERYLQ